MNCENLHFQFAISGHPLYAKLSGKVYTYILTNLEMINLRLQRRPWHPTPVLLPGKSQGRRSLVGCSPWGREESDMTEVISLSLFTFMHWRRKWQPTPVFLPGESQGWQSLVGCHQWGRTESDMTEATQQQQQQPEAQFTCTHLVVFLRTGNFFS